MIEEGKRTKQKRYGYKVG